MLLQPATFMLHNAFEFAVHDAFYGLAMILPPAPVQDARADTASIIFPPHLLTFQRQQAAQLLLHT